MKWNPSKACGYEDLKESNQSKWRLVEVVLIHSKQRSFGTNPWSKPEAASIGSTSYRWIIARSGNLNSSLLLKATSL